MRIGITGQAGFVGTHLYNLLGLKKDIERVPFADEYFADEEKLCSFVRGCDVIVHLAAMNRHSDPQVIYDTNVELVNKLIAAMEKEKVAPHVIFSSSIQEELDNPYGASKKLGRELLQKWAEKNGGKFSGCVIPNVFGPFGRPNYNSFVATFCHKLTHNETPEIKVDGSVKLIYVGDLCEKIIALAVGGSAVNPCPIAWGAEKKVSEVLALLENFKKLYLEQGIIPELKSVFEIQLFNTFCSYIELEKFFPFALTPHSDPRGSFVEVIKLGVGGQVSFSTTKSGITRGNHYHTRKIERFAVIKGSAKIELRKIGTDEKISFLLDGSKPGFVDMPVWYTHNISNIGEEDLYTLFWINEFFDPADPDTFFEEV